MNAPKFHSATASDPMPSSADTWTFLSGRQPDSLFIVPFSRDTHFLGREGITGLIHTKYESERRVALTGIGGIGWVISVDLRSIFDI